MKKVICGMLAFCMVWMGIGVSMAQETSDPNASENPRLSEAVAKLQSYDIMNGFGDGTFRAEGTLTRAEMATVLVRLNGLRENQKGPTKFTDVSEEHWASGYINLAEAMGFAQGNGDGTFLPDEKVTYEQAVKMVVAVLGYTPMAEASGGYPAGYIMTAGSIGLLKGVTNNNIENPILLGETALVLYNALACPLMLQVSYGAAEEFAIFDGKNGIGLVTLETKLYNSCLFLMDKDNRIILSVKDIEQAEADCRRTGDYYYITLNLNEKGTEKIAAATEKIADYSSGDNIIKAVYGGQVIAAPRVLEKITSDGVEITGEFSEEYAREVVKTINQSISENK